MRNAIEKIFSTPSLLILTIITILAFIVLIVCIVTVSIPRYGVSSTEVDPKIIDEIPVPLGILRESQSLEHEGELHFEHVKLEKEELLIGEEAATVFIGKDELNKGLVYLKVNGADDSMLSVILCPVDIDTDSSGMRPYAEGYYPLTHGAGEYLCVVFARQGNGVNSEVFRTTIIATFDKNEPYLYSNVFSHYSDDSALAKKAYEITHMLDDYETKVQNVTEYINKNIKYAYELVDEASNELVDSDAVFDEGGGICYHFSALCSSMLKSVGIHSREVRGFVVFENKMEYHSWNEYLNEMGEWITVDSTGLISKDNSAYVRTEFSER